MTAQLFIIFTRDDAILSLLFHSLTCVNVNDGEARGRSELPNERENDLEGAEVLVTVQQTGQNARNT